MQLREVGEGKRSRHFPGLWERFWGDENPLCFLTLGERKLPLLEAGEVSREQEDVGLLCSRLAARHWLLWRGVPDLSREPELEA